MKPLRILAIAAVAAALASCAQEKLETTVAPGLFKAGIEQPTRVAFSDEGVFSWSEGDAVAIVTNAGLKNFTLVSGAGSKNASFNGDLSGVTSATAAIYPAAIAKDAATVSLPAEYAWTEGQSNAAMVATPVSLTEVNTFKHVGGIIKIVCSDIPADADALLLSAEAKITGDFTIADGKITAGEGSDQVKITFTPGSNPAAFYIPVPTGTFKFGVSFLKGTEAVGPAKSTSEAKTIGRATLLLMTDVAGEIVSAGISTAEDLKAFRDAVNAGGDLAAWTVDGVVFLNEDIDLGGEEWTPIGNGTFTTGNVLSGSAFTGIFDGCGHKITGLNVTVPADAPAGTAAGLFGALNGATIRNLTIGEGSRFTSHTTKLAGIGAVAGYVIDSDISNCVSYAEMSSDGSADNVRFCMGGVLGVVASDAKGSVVDGCVNYGKLTSVNTENTKNGATGLSVGGVIAFTDAKGTESNTVKNCVNNGVLEVQATRTGGVVATANKYTKVEDCVNNAKISCSDVKASNSRAAGITSAAGAEVYLTRCINKGDVVFPVAGDKVHGYVAGIIGQINNAAVVVDACENYGTILSDMWYDMTEKTDGGNTYRDTFMGLIVASCNSTACTLRNNKVGGKLGPYSNPSEVVEATSANFMELFSLNSYRNRKAVIEDNNVFADGSGPDVPSVGIKSAEDLLAWAAAVNDGASTEAWEYESGKVAFLNDIDMAGVEWKPVKDLPESKELDGKGFAIKNWSTRAGKGALMLRCSGTARNIVLDRSCQFVWTQGEGSGFIVDTVSTTGIIEDCVNYATAATYTEALTISGCHFNYIAHQINGAVRNCVNYGDINIDVPSCNQNIWAAPMGAFFNVSSLGEDFVAVSGCKNYGNISVHVATCPKKTYIGGVVGGSTDAGSYAKQTVNKGVVSGCENYGNISYKFDTSNNGNYYNVGGVTAYVEGKVFDCVNEGKVEVVVSMDDSPNPNTRPAIGGVCAFARYGIARCTNKGDIYVEGCYGAGGITSTACGMNANPSFGGVVGQVGPSDGTTSETFVITDLHNEGTLRTNLSMKPSAGTNSFIGGCIGITYLAIDKCDNTGHLDITSMQRYTMVGGVVGRPFNDVSNCWNAGKIDCNLGDPDAIGENTGSSKNQRSQAMYIGGIAGDHNMGGKTLSNLENRAGADITVVGGYTYSTANYYGGIVGRMNTCVAELKNCTNYGNLTSVAVPRCVRIGGIIGMGNANVVSGCRNYGNIAGNMAGSANAAIGGLMGFLTCNSDNCVLSDCSTEGDVTATGNIGGAALFIGGQGNTSQTWKSSTVSGALNAPAEVLAGYILGGFVLNKVDLVASLTFDASAPMKIKSGSSFNGTAVSASDLAQNRILGSIAGTNKSEEPIEAAITYPEGAVVIE